MCFYIVDDVRMSSFDKHPCLFRHELEWDTQEDVLLRQIGDRADEDAANIVGATNVRDHVDIEKEMSSCNAGDRERFGDFFWCRGWRHDVDLKQELLAVLLGKKCSLQKVLSRKLDHSVNTII